MYSLLLPYALCLLILGFFLSLFYKKWLIGFILVCVIISLNWFGRIYSVHPLRKTKNGQVKLMTFNVHSTGQGFEENQQGILSLILEEDPDFLFMTELGGKGKMLHSTLKSIYPYTNVPGDVLDYYAEPFYSKFPIDTIEVLSLPHYYHSIYRAQIYNGSDTLSVYCCHLSSNLVNESNGRIGGIREGYRRRAMEAGVIHNSIMHERLPSIVIGDLNDISGSFALRRIEKSGMKDAWWKGGFGYGTTYHGLGLRFRLDHILYEDARLSLNGVKTINTSLSDHNAIVASFSIKGTTGEKN